MSRTVHLVLSLAALAAAAAVSAPAVAAST